MGNLPVPNRAVGAFNRIIRDILLEAAEEAGNLIAIQAGVEPEGLKTLFVATALQHPVAFLGACCRVMPQQIQATVRSSTVVVYKTEEEIKRALIERNIPVARVYPLIAYSRQKQKQADNAA